MKITVPKTSGFCYGVSLAVKEAERIISEDKSLIMFGEIVHNPDVVGSLEKKGGVTIDDTDEVLRRVDEIKSFENKNPVVLIRAHGVPKSVEDMLFGVGAEVRDRTCPKVKKVHNIVKDEEEKGRRIVIVGNPKHPEVIGIFGQSEHSPSVISTPEEAEKADLTGEISVVVQTTFNGKLFEKIREVILSVNPHAEIFNTMCPATNIRQQEIFSLSKNADFVIVFGGKKSSNSLKLRDIAGMNTNAVLVEKISEIDLKALEGKENVVVCGGSSTPYELIDAAAKYIKECFGAEIEYL